MTDLSADSHEKHYPIPPTKQTPARIAGWTLLFAGMMLLFFVLTLVALVMPRPRSLDESNAARRKELVGNVKAQQLAKLNSYGWVDEQKHIAHIPIEKAMADMAAQAAAPKPAPVSTPVPAATPEIKQKQ